MHLALADIALTNIQSQRAIILRIRASKMDQLRVGTTIVLGATKAEICPVAALLTTSTRGVAPQAHSSLLKEEPHFAGKHSQTTSSKP